MAMLLVTGAGAPIALGANVVISQVYGGGGNAGATLRNDFIEIFNRGTTAVSLAGWSVQYASDTGTTWQVTPLSGSLAPGQYFLVKEAAGAGGTADLPAPDASGNIAMHAQDGKVALVPSITPLSGACPAAIDLVGYGSADCSEGGAAVTLNNTTAALRLQNGCADTDNNTADFIKSTPVPRNKLSPPMPCGGVNAPPAITAPANPIKTVAQDAAPFTVDLTGSDDGGIYVWSATAGAGVSNVYVAGGQGTSQVTYSLTLQTGFSGIASFTASLSDTANAPVAQTVNIHVTTAGPAGSDHLVISQIYGGGGNASAVYHNDYVELYNPTPGAVAVNGWTIQYASATGTAWQSQALGGTIGPAEYYLIALASSGASGIPLPAPNVEGTINLSATAGKVALVADGEPLDGCPVAEAYVDLVGYGANANCSEGAMSAPGGNNTVAVFRKNGGATDTDVNAADFETAAPNPRRLSPVVELGPSVLRVEPRSGTASAPRDASVSVTFTEAVTVSQGWCSITCATSGAHGGSDATVASVSGGRTWIVTPNTNFRAGEQCSITIDKLLVHDVDTDDSGPNSDMLPENYSATFTVAIGADPPYPPTIHLAMGNPSHAAADLLTPDNYLMEKPEYALSYNRDRGGPNWASWHLDDSWIGDMTRVDSFRPDPAVPPDWYRVLNTDFAGSGFDRGHLVPNADRDNESSVPINQATFLMSNMLPQAPDNNQGPWARFESYLRSLLPDNEIYIVAGGAGTGGTGDNGFMTSIADGHVAVPAKTWKVALVLPKSAGDDVQRVNAGTRTIAVIMPNIQGIRSDDWHQYLTTVDDVEALTGYDFFANVGDAVENAVEAGVDGVNPPGVADQSASADEDTAQAITLAAASAGGAPLTYTIVSGPEHGTLSGSGASRAYTPAADFNGTDRFTFRASTGGLISNVATATVTVLEVNDAPRALDDVKRTAANTTLHFAASDLTANDLAGPENERGQTLTVTSVTPTAKTQGTATLSDGAVIYTPAPNFRGTASFAYSVCDNGRTRGATAPLCATGNVDVIVDGQTKRRAVRP